MNMYFSKYYDEKNQTLIIPNNFNNLLENLPLDVKTITFYSSSKFNQKVGHQGCADNDCPRNLPHGLTSLTFGKDFNQNVDTLPSSLTHLTLGWSFNQKVDSLPDNLTYLVFGTNFNNQVDHLPSKLIYLTFGWAFDQRIDNLPENLTHITFGNNFNQNLDDLPRKLTHLTFSRFSGLTEKIDNLPSGLQIIKMTSIKTHLIKKIPHGCKIVDYDDNDNYNDNDNH